ncbi:MAG TPA: hypothetical protein VMN60_07290, partial [Longimicrobiales bacterium]|nr:hypothetical protein [Longimicrobiales bacterium]
QRRILRLFQRRELLDAATVENMLTWQGSGGFSLDASVRIHGTDRAGHERDPGTRFLFLSGYTADAFGELGFLPGLDVFREKPITPTDLLAVVNELLRAASATHTSEAPRAA